ncbi:hypothetical protein [Paramicrobacterium fandaimingii]|uniref:hypothetical protein n=1 Tax=Paramicrobacterium fandaimingii TaxID=2708079 RepID=UPI001421DECF|nr:hypothetical protein [Microbacterium fandaimingii]
MSWEDGEPLIIDAGPTLTFTAAGQRELLMDVVTRRGSRLLMPESVIDEVARKSSQQKRFAECENDLANVIAHGQIEKLRDDIEDVALSQQVNRITGLGTRVRLGESKDLGETMVIAHALKLKQSGAEARVFIDEWRGQRVALRHGLKVVSTESILVGAISLKLVSDRGEMRKIYDKLREFDDGLVHIDQTQLLSRERYRRARS